MSRVERLDPPICEWCGCFITERGQPCPARDEGECHP